MPPKSKKQQEEEARRLEQERKRKQEQEALLEIERKKYASELLTETGLTLPFTALFLSEFPNKPLAWAEEHIHRYLSNAYPALVAQPKAMYDTFLQQTLAALRFCALKIDVKSKNEALVKARYEQARVLMGVFISIMASNSKVFNSTPESIVGEKTKQDDRQLFKKLIVAHSSNRGPGTKKILSKEAVQMFIAFLDNSYFGHYTLIHHWSNIEKRGQNVQIHNIVQRPIVCFNQLTTKFTDLSVAEHTDKKQ